MLRWVLAVMGACATLGPGTALAQVRTVADAVAAIEAAEDGKPRPLGNPGEWITDADYPPQALREEASGMTRVRLDIDGQGVPTHCSIAVTGGSEALDSTTCAVLMERARFHPVLNNAGIAVPSVFETSVVWAMPTPQPIDSPSRPYAITAFVEEDGSVSTCRWVGPDAPAIDPSPLCNRGSWVDHRDVDGNLVRGEIQIRISQRELDELAVPRDDPNNPANREIEIVFLEDGGVSECRWTGANPPAFDPLVACNYVVDSLKRAPALAAMMHGRKTIRLDENEVATLATRAARER